uniref:Uncharacterized protein n=1 Tax=Octopus bimaculoides TaxID=37653 RepID=A0A0L8H5Z3_OCTBM
MAVSLRKGCIIHTSKYGIFSRKMLGFKGSVRKYVLKSNNFSFVNQISLMSESHKPIS